MKAVQDIAVLVNWRLICSDSWWFAVFRPTRYRWGSVSENLYFTRMNISGSKTNRNNKLTAQGSPTESSILGRDAAFRENSVTACCICSCWWFSAPQILSSVQCLFDFNPRTLWNSLYACCKRRCSHVAVFRELRRRRRHGRYWWFGGSSSRSSCNRLYNRKFPPTRGAPGGGEVYSIIADQWFDDQTFCDTLPDNARMSQKDLVNTH